MKKYIPVLMEMYQEMLKGNSEKRYDPLYSETMLHSIIVIINRLNNK